MGDLIAKLLRRLFGRWHAPHHACPITCSLRRCVPTAWAEGIVGIKICRSLSPLSVAGFAKRLHR